MDSKETPIARPRGIPLPNLETLRNGVILDSRWKLVERISRWVAKRRFRARTTYSDEETMLLFFEVDDAVLDAWQERLPALASISNQSLLPIEEVREIQGFRFISAEWKVAVPLDEQLLQTGPLSPRLARDVATALLPAIRKLLAAGIEFPAPSIETVLLQDPKFGSPAILFPLVLPGFPLVREEKEAAAYLRDLLFVCASGLAVPEQYGPKERALLPGTSGEVWLPALVDHPGLEEIQAALDGKLIPLSTQPSSRTDPGPVSIPVKRSKSEPAPVLSVQGPGEKVDFETPEDSKQTAPAPKSLGSVDWTRIVSAIAALIVAGMVAWFARSVLVQLAPPTVSSLASASGTMPTRPNVRNESGIPSSRENSVPNQAPLLADLRNPGTTLKEYSRDYSQRPEDSDKEARLAGLLKQLEPEIDAIRANQRIGILEGVEAAAATGYPPARLLLAKILWGRDTSLSEKLAIELAREGNEDARKWCEQRYIEWDPQ